jgi:superfamily II DNA or RNA helicase
MSISFKNIDNCNDLDKNKIKNIANKFNIDTKNKNKSELCNSIKRKYKITNPCSSLLSDDTELILKKHQLNVANFLYNNHGVAVIHSVGTGKTLTAVSSAQCLLLNNIIKKVIVVTPTSLQENFKQQMKFYNVDEKLFKHYHFYTITGLVNAINNKTVINANDALLIIDEVHNLRTLEGNRFKQIYKYSLKAKRVLLLTATPFINYSYDIINLVALTTGNKPITTDEFENIKEKPNLLKKYLENIFNVYTKKQDDSNFPDKKIYEIFLKMPDSYTKIYNDVENGEVKKIPDFKNKNINVFYNGLRRASNIIDDKSPKVDWITDKINSEPKEHYIIFSHYITMGIKPIMKYLDKKKLKYTSVTGDMDIKERQKAVNQYNNGEIKILFISMAGSEGLDLKNTKYIIILEPSWNESSIEQIIGRGVRYKSHEKLPKSKRVVTIYKLYCVKPDEYENIDKIVDNYYLEYNNEMLSVDLYLRNFSILKQQRIEHFYKLFIKYKI